MYGMHACVPSEQCSLKTSFSWVYYGGLGLDKIEQSYNAHRAVVHCTCKYHATCSQPVPVYMLLGAACHPHVRVTSVANRLRRRPCSQPTIACMHSQLALFLLVCIGSGSASQTPLINSSRFRKA